MTMTIRAIECESAADAIQYADASGFGEPVSIDGKPMVVPQADLDKIAAAGMPFAYFADHVMPDGESRIMTIPIN